MITDVHTRHCCARHGCARNEDATCTVMLGQASQERPCETCEWDDDKLRPFRSVIDKFQRLYNLEVDITEKNGFIQIRGDSEKVCDVLKKIEQDLDQLRILNDKRIEEKP